MNETKRQMLTECEVWIENHALEAEQLNPKRAFCEGYKKGMREGIARYAIWKDGTQWLGCGNHTLKEGLEILDKELEE